MGLGQIFYNALVDFAESVFKAMTGWLKPIVKEELHNVVGSKVFNEDNFMSPEGKKAAKQLKDVWKDSPGDSPDIIADVVDALTGRGAKLQLQYITEKQVDADMHVTQRLFDQMAVITDLNLIANILGILGEFVPAFHFDQIGNEIRAYLDYSGLTQITGFGYGMLLSAAIAPKITQEIDAKMQYTALEPRDVVNLDFREEKGLDDFFPRMALKGYSKKNAKYMRTVQRPLLDARRLINLYRRDHIDRDKFFIDMRKLGFGNEDIRLLLKESLYFPSLRCHVSTD
ncbi:unnamed protein product [marine sediment metagenome]|uniref:Uncharacterized protein n=1 Tax=marine sediment metagenome TaxID=412755 RepID=X1EM73_9ZZZZ